MTFEELQRIKQWHLRHRADHPLENHLWDAMLTLWLAGWVGWVPTIMFDVYWAAPACILAVFAPSLYVAWRMHAHRTQRLRCDWLPR